jgi:hypothetical protein
LQALGVATITRRCRLVMPTVMYRSFAVSDPGQAQWCSVHRENCRSFVE